MTSAIKVATMKSKDHIYGPKGSHHMQLPNRSFLLTAKDEWDTKEDTGESMKNALVCQKAPLELNSEKSSP